MGIRVRKNKGLSEQGRAGCAQTSSRNMHLGRLTSARYAFICLMSVMLLILLGMGILYYFSRLNSDANNESVSQTKHLDELRVGRRLLLASARGQLDVVVDLLAETDSSVCGVDKRGYTALHYALESHKVMLESRSVTLQPSSAEHEEVVKKLVEHQTFPQCSAYLCPAYFAVHYRNIPALESILHSSPDKTLQLCLTSRDTHNNTVFHAAAASRAAGFARFFMKRLAGDDPNKSQRQDEQSKITGQQCHRAQTALEILNLAEIRNANKGKLTFKELTDAIGHQDMVILLKYAQQIGLEQAVNMLDGWGNTPLHIAAAAGRVKLVSFLLKHGADIDLVNQFNQTASDVSIDNTLTDLLKSQHPHAQRHGKDEEATRNVWLESCSANQAKEYHESIPGSQQHTNNGGWQATNRHDSYEIELQMLGRYYSTQCHIELWHSDNISRSLLYSYIAKRKPIAIHGFLEDWLKSNRWSRESFLRRHGHRSVEVSHVPYADQYGVGGQTEHMRLEEYIRQLMNNSLPHTHRSRPYVFDGKLLHQSEKMWAEVDIPWPFADLPILLKQLIIGPPGSGSPPHFHGPVINCLLYGRKVWHLFPPPQSFFTHGTARDWFEEVSANSSRVDKNSYYFVQEAGDVLVLPDLWGHAVINIQNSVAVALEFAFNKL